MASRTGWWPISLLLLLTLVLAACGPEAEPVAPAAEPTQNPADLVLGTLAARVTSGEGISDATWSDDVGDVADTLWPDDPTLKRTHHNLANIAGDMAKWLGEDEGARERWLKQDPASVAIHDGFTEAIGGGVETYRAWVESQGRALLDARFRALAGERPPR